MGRVVPQVYWRANRQWSAFVVKQKRRRACFFCGALLSHVWMAASGSSSSSGARRSSATTTSWLDIGEKGYNSSSYLYVGGIPLGLSDEEVRRDYLSRLCVRSNHPGDGDEGIRLADIDNLGGGRYKVHMFSRANVFKVSVDRPAHGAAHMWSLTSRAALPT